MQLGRSNQISVGNRWANQGAPMSVAGKGYSTKGGGISADVRLSVVATCSGFYFYDPAPMEQVQTKKYMLGMGTRLLRRTPDARVWFVDVLAMMVAEFTGCLHLVSRLQPPRL